MIVQRTNLDGLNDGVSWVNLRNVGRQNLAQ
jgi:hypothetical protein